MALRDTTIDRIDDALKVVDNIEQEHKVKFQELGLAWTGYGEAMTDVLEKASRLTHYSIATLRRYRNERRARKGRFSKMK